MSEETGTPEGQRLTRALLAIRALRARVEELEALRAEPIAIVGMACRFPGGATDPDRYWEMLESGVDGIVEIPSSRMVLDGLYDPKADPDSSTTIYTRRAGLLADVDHFDAAFFRVSPREAMSLDPQHRLALEVSWEALERAAMAPSSLAGTRTGVVLGMTLSDHDHLIRESGSHNIDTYHLSGNCLNFAAGRIAYLLGLHGPTLVLDSACSSSLVAIHLACQSLRTGEADLMLAGGVNVILSPDGTLMVCKMRMLSPDGRCKTFDAAADGFVRGEGCGIVVLKRLSEAVRDRDPIVAVIRSTAINQDGASSGLTVPNGIAQQALIREALARAGVTADDIGYLECHGTGTALGDPIEVEALGAVLARQRARGPLAIGSVKTNFGHLESASGVAGLMKAALVVQHGAIPPHLHLREVNPHLSLRDGNITIPTRLTPWPEGSAPRLAGVSSFGASGTNAHAILEEPPRFEPAAKGAAETPATPPGLEILCLSARTPTALRELAGRHAAALAGAHSLADVCFTAAVGRDHFEHRIALTGRDAGAIIDRLRAVASGAPTGDVEHGELAEKKHEVVFLFPGQGAQYPGMGRDLYQQVPAFRAGLDECRRWLDPELDRPLLDLIHPRGDSRELLDQTQYTQPAIFAIEYALAQMWLSFGIEPAVMVGHSVGEYVAACIAGILTLEDACRLIAARGRLMHERSQPGAMAALFTDESVANEVLDGLTAEVGIAAVNGPMNVVVAGTEGGVARVLDRCVAREVKSKRLAVSHAFHSPLMEPVLEPFRKLAATLGFGEARRTVVSNLTGGELAAGEASSAEYWCRHVREPVRFADSMKWLLERDHRVFLEVGPGSTLVGLAQQTIPAAARAWVASLRKGREEWPQLLQAVGALYCGGAAPSWPRFFQGRNLRRVVVPTYPFEGKRFRKTPAQAAAQPSSGSSPVVRMIENGDAQGLARLLEATVRSSKAEADLIPRLAAELIEQHRGSQETQATSLLYEVEWRPNQRKTNEAAAPSPGSWLLLADRNGVAERVADELERRGQHAVVARPAATLTLEGTDWTFDASRPEHYRSMLAALENAGPPAPGPIQGIVHCLGLDSRPLPATTARTLDEDHEHALTSLLHLEQALKRQVRSAPLAWPAAWILTRGAAPVDSAPGGFDVAASVLWGAGRALALERPEAWAGLVDLDPAGDGNEGRHVVDELVGSDGEDLIAWRRGQRYAPRMVAATGISHLPLQLAPDRTCLLTGGLGESGIRVVRLLVQRGARHLVLVERRVVATPDAQHLLGDLKDAGIDVRVVHADISRPEEMRRVEAALAETPPLAGVVHVSANSCFAASAEDQAEASRAELEVEVAGAWALHELTRERSLDFFVGFSSIAALWGSTGRPHDAAANQFLDALAHARRQLGLPAVSVSYVPFSASKASQGGGMLSEELARCMANLGVEPVDPDQGTRALEAAIKSGRAALVLAKADWNRFRGVIGDAVQERAHARRRRPLFDELDAPATAPAAASRGAGSLDLRAQLAATAVEMRQELLVEHIQDQMAQLLGFSAERPDSRRGFIELGVDSLMAVTLRNRIQTSLGVDLPVTFIFDHPTVEVLADHLLENVLSGELRAPPSEAPVTAGNRGALVDEVRELSQEQIEHAITEQLKDLGLH